MRWDPQKSCVIDGEIFLPLNFPSVIYLSSFCGFTWATYEIYSSIGTNLLWLSVSTELRWYSLMRVLTLADNHYYFCFLAATCYSLIVCYVNRLLLIFLRVLELSEAWGSPSKHPPIFYPQSSAVFCIALPGASHFWPLCPQQQSPPS